jgi:hypothetical protein
MRGERDLTLEAASGLCGALGLILIEVPAENDKPQAKSTESPVQARPERRKTPAASLVSVCDQARAFLKEAKDHMCPANGRHKDGKYVNATAYSPSAIIHGLIMAERTVAPLDELPGDRIAKVLSELKTALQQGQAIYKQTGKGTRGSAGSHAWNMAKRFPELEEKFVKADDALVQLSKLVADVK